MLTTRPPKNAGLTVPHCTGVKRVTAEVRDTGYTHELCKF
jgi:hypothetical protein